MRGLRLPVLSSGWLWALLAPALTFMALATNQNYLADFWHHLARGQAIVTQGRMVDEDLFTYTVPGRPFQDVNWLSQVGYYGMYQHGGLALVQTANALVLALMMLVLVWHCRRAAGAWSIAGTLGVLVFFGLWQVLTIRPQTFSLLLFVLLHDLLARSRERPLLLLGAPPILALWANLHGAFPAGLILVGAFLLAAGWTAAQEHGWRVDRSPLVRALALCLAACLLATMISPYGWRVYDYVRTTSSVAADRHIDEWAPPSLELLIGKAWAVSLVLVLAACALPRRRPQPLEVAAMLCFLPLACGSARMVPWWLLAAAPVLAAQCAAALPAIVERDRAERPSFGVAAVCALIVTAAVFCLPGLSRHNPIVSARRAASVQRDLEAVQAYLRGQAPAGRIFSRFEWGEYLTWALGPDYAVFMDGRIEIFPDDVWAQYAAVTTGRPDWEVVLDRYHVDYLLADAEYHARTGLLAQLQQARGWEEAFHAGQAVLYVRRPVRSNDDQHRLASGGPQPPVQSAHIGMLPTGG